MSMFDGSTMKGIREAVSSYAASFDPNQITAVTAQGVVDDAIATENMLATIKALAAKRVADTKLWEREGHLSPAHHLAKKSGTSVAKAKEALETADALAKLAGLDAAARSGELSSSQAGAIADAATKNPKAEERLVKLAKKGSLGELKDECARTKAAAEPDPAAAHRAIHRSRFLRRRRTVDGAGEITYRSTLEEVSEIWSIVQGYAQRVFEKARAEGRREPEEAYLADGLLAATRAGAAAAKAAADARAAAKKRAARSTAAGGETSGGASGAGACDPASGATPGPTSPGGTSEPSTGPTVGPSAGGASEPASGATGDPMSTGGTSGPAAGPTIRSTSTGRTSDPSNGPTASPTSAGGISEPPTGNTPGPVSTGKAPDRTSGPTGGPTSEPSGPSSSHAGATSTAPSDAGEKGVGATSGPTGTAAETGAGASGSSGSSTGTGPGTATGPSPAPTGATSGPTTGPTTGSSPASAADPEAAGENATRHEPDDPMAPPVRPAKVIVRIDWRRWYGAGP
ncbi:MAG TPA: hypothetical protein VNA57_08410 [Acidimicrobiales bacterium]|nr:hypothetical protein [Acidimicrobiales bacterium]